MATYKAHYKVNWRLQSSFYDRTWVATPSHDEIVQWLEDNDIDFQAMPKLESPSPSVFAAIEPSECVWLNNETDVLLFELKWN